MNFGELIVLESSATITIFLSTNPLLKRKKLFVIIYSSLDENKNTSKKNQVQAKMKDLFLFNNSSIFIKVLN
ncbi:TPA: hypothetical protein DCZ31_02610 [Patescibacteria group bacterium]|nr:hypothetical protein [Candidatus Gracilibacteria bacterium]